MSDEQIMALLDERVREAERKFLASPEVKRIKAHMEHMWMTHGSGELCSCPEWADVPGVLKSW